MLYFYFFKKKPASQPGKVRKSVAICFSIVEAHILFGVDGELLKSEGNNRGAAGTVERLDHLDRSPPGDAFPRHKLYGMHASIELIKHNNLKPPQSCLNGT